MEGINGNFGQAGILDMLALPYLLLGRLLPKSKPDSQPSTRERIDAGNERNANRQQDGGAWLQPIMQMIARNQQLNPGVQGYLAGQGGMAPQPFIGNEPGGPAGMYRMMSQPPRQTPPGTQPFISNSGPGAPATLGYAPPAAIDEAQRQRTLQMFMALMQQPRL